MPIRTLSRMFPSNLTLWFGLAFFPRGQRLVIQPFPRRVQARLTSSHRPASALIMALAAVSIHSKASADVILFADFSDTSILSLNGNARVVGAGSNSVLRLADAVPFSSGSVFSSATVNARDFFTKFSFRISNPGGIDDPADGVAGADGLAFVVQSVSSTIGGLGGGLGYDGISNSVAVGFDTYQNFEFGDPDGNHIEIDSDGSVTSLQTAPVGPRLDSGTVFFAWIAYDGTTLSAWLNTADILPASPIISRSIDIALILGQDFGFVGFTGATGSAWGDHDILTWEYQPFIPEPSAAALLGLGGLVAARRRR